MNAQELLARINTLNVWKKGDQRAPHKPLLLLLALARLNTGQPRLIAFDEIEKKLTTLLEDFGPSRANYYPELPFWHLQSDQIWELPNAMGVLTASGSVSKKYLRDHHVQAGFTPEVYDVLKGNPELLEQVAMQLLEDNFPTSFAVSACAWKTPRLRWKLPTSNGFRRVARILKTMGWPCVPCTINYSTEAHWLSRTNIKSWCRKKPTDTVVFRSGY
jgi:putative restriction endonuclease